MIAAASHAAAVRRSDDHRNAELTRRAIANLGGFGHEQVEARKDKVDELDFSDWLETVERHADCGTDDAGFGQWRVDDAIRSELVDESFGDQKDSAANADVLAQDDHILVALHLLHQRGLERLHHRGLGFLGCLHCCHQFLRP